MYCLRNEMSPEFFLQNHQECSVPYCSLYKTVGPSLRACHLRCCLCNFSSQSSKIELLILADMRTQQDAPLGGTCSVNFHADRFFDFALWYNFLVVLFTSLYLCTDTVIIKTTPTAQLEADQSTDDRLSTLLHYEI